MPKKELKDVELIVYQISEVKNLLENITVRFDSYRDNTDKRIIALELSQAAALAKLEEKPIDVQKIVLAAFTLVSGALAVFFGIN